MPRFNHRDGHRRDYLRGFGMQFWNTGASATGAHGGSELDPRLRRRAEDRRSSAAIRPGSRCTRTARCCPTPTTASPSATPATIATACRSSRSTTASATTSGRWPSTWPTPREAIAKAAGAELVDYKRADIDRNGSAIHEHGTCRMGDDPKRSALNALQPDARGAERLRRRRLGLPHRDREEPDAHDPGPVVARDRSPGRTAQARRLTPCKSSRAPRSTPSSSSAAAPPAAWRRGT